MNWMNMLSSLMLKMRKPSKKISYIIASRNDSYCGDSVGRLQTVLNHTGEILNKNSKLEESEIILCDWASPAKNGPLSKKLQINKATRSILKIVEVPEDIAKKYQKDSPFSEVHAMNTGFRNSTGKFFARIDQDTLIGERFIDYFYNTYFEDPNINWPLVAFSGRRNLDFKQSLKYRDWVFDLNKSLKVEICHPHAFYSRMIPHRKNSFTFYGAAVGVMIVERELYLKHGGFNEDLIYMNNMDVEFMSRLAQETLFLNLSLRTEADFYHLHHSRSEGAEGDNSQPHSVDIGSRKTNPNSIRMGTKNNNAKDWGLLNENLIIS